jgi:hypothetical protein
MTVYWNIILLRIRAMKAFSTDDTGLCVGIIKWPKTLKSFTPRNTKIIQICHRAKRIYILQFITQFVRRAAWSNSFTYIRLAVHLKITRYKSNLFLWPSALLHGTVWYSGVLRRLALTLAVVLRRGRESPTIMCLLQVTDIFHLWIHWAEVLLWLVRAS